MRIENILLLAVVFAAGIFDYRYRKVPNIITFPAMIGGIVIASSHGGMAGLSVPVFGLFLGLAFLSFPYAMGGIGAGDVKLLGAIGAIKGPWFICVTFLAAAIIGGIMAVGRMAFITKGSDMRILRESIKTIYYTGALSAIEVPEYALKEKLPYAVAISAGAVVALILEVR